VEYEMGGSCGTYGEELQTGFWGVKYERKRPFGRPKGRWEYDIKIEIWEIGWEGMNWLNLAAVSGKWRAVVNTVMNLWVSLNVGILL
jgi:hypothetical protein